MSEPSVETASDSPALDPWERIDAETEEIAPEPEPEEIAAFDPAPVVEMEQEPATDGPESRGGWTITLLCIGIALIACCVLIPQNDANRRLRYEREVLQRDLQAVDRQVAVNGEFLRKVGQDPTLAERLAERQMKVIPQGARVLDLPDERGGGMSPFQLVNVAAPPTPPPYRPLGGVLANLCYDPHTRLYLIGASLGLIAAGLVLGYTPQRRD